MDAGSDPAILDIVVMTSSQVGKTEILNNQVAYYIDQDPAPILVVQPTLELSEAWSKDRLAPMLRDSPKLRGTVKDPRSRDSGNTLKHKVFPGGHITMAGANSAAGLSSRPIRVVLADEIDRYPASAGTEGDPVTLARKRSTTFWNRKTILFSTPTIKGASRIESGWLDSDQRRFFVPCPHCGHEQTLIWAMVKWTEGQPDSAMYACEECGALWDDSQRWRAVQSGHWVITRPEGRSAGFHLNEIYSPWVSLREIVSNFLSAKHGGPETLKAWVNTSLGETWEEAAEAVDHDSLFARRENYGPEALPAGIIVITAGVDVQADRLEVEAVGYCADSHDEPPQSWGVEHNVLYGDPAKPQVWRELDEFLKRIYRTEDGRTLRILAACIDTGGHHAAEVYAFCRTRLGRNIYPIKGTGGARPIWPKRASKSRKHRGENVWSIGVDVAKDAIYARLRIVEVGPGYCHFPIDYDESWFEQLTVEKIKTRFIKGHPVREWIKPNGARNEALDMRVYSLAALHSQLVNLSWHRLQVKSERTSTSVPQATSHKPQPRPSPRRPVNRSGGSGSWL